MKRSAGVLFVLSLAWLVSPGAHCQTYTYDNYGRVTAVVAPNGAKTVYSYDKADNRRYTQTALNGVATVPNAAPVCEGGGHLTLHTSGSVTITPADLGCTDDDGDTLFFTARNPTLHTTMAGNGSYITITYTATTALNLTVTVSDGNGGTTNSLYWVNSNAQ